jgi:hypothetical protein
MPVRVTYRCLRDPLAIATSSVRTSLTWVDMQVDMQVRIRQGSHCIATPNMIDYPGTPRAVHS